MPEEAAERPRGYEQPTPDGTDAGGAAARADERPAGAASASSRRVRGAIAACALALAALVALAACDMPAVWMIGSATLAAVVGIGGVVVLVRTLAGLRREHAQLAQREADALRMAELDELTGLGNYRMFSRQLAAEVARSRRHDDPFSLVLLDLDGFKAINDELGHLAGDDALRHVAAALRDALREEDVCCRQGGDEFAVIAVRAGAEEAADLSERLVQAIEQIPFGVNGERRLGACAGWATFGEPARSSDELILHADGALRSAKRSSSAGERPRLPALRRPAGRLGRGETARLALLSGVARALAGARDERTLAETTVAFMTGAFDTVGSAAVALWPHADAGHAATFSPRLVVLGTGGEPPTADGGLAARSSVRRALAAAGPAVVESDPALPWVDGAEVRTELAVAVPDGTAIWGCLLIACDRPRAYGIVERALAEAIAQQLGRALSCRRLLDKLSVSGFGALYRIAADADAETAGLTGPGLHGDDDAEQWRLADLAWRVGRALELDDDERRALYLAALFHNVGTVGVPAALLAHPGELHDEERAILREHPLIGERMLRALPLLRDAAPIVRHEHERWDGAGYPDGLAGDQIPLEARILLACDVFVSMTSPRPWRPPRTGEAARAELRRVAGAQLDPRVVETLLALLDDDADGRAPDDDERTVQPAGV